MKKLVKILLFPLIAATLTGCPMPWEKDTETEHFREYNAITGKFILHDALDERIDCSDTYFVFDGSKGNFSMKYFEHGVLKREGKFEKILSKTDQIGKWCNNLSLGLNLGGRKYDHISTYCENFDPINQFRILEEYASMDYKYFFS